MKCKIYAILVLFLVISSCRTKPPKDNLNYMQNIEELATEVSIRNAKSTLQPGDMLEIYVTAKDMDVVKPFNRQYSSSQHVSSSAGNTPTTGGNMSGPVPYTIDANGNIDFSGLGVINTTGQSVMELKEDLYQRLQRYIINPTVTIKLLNFKISVLGEVRRQGEFTMPNGEATIVNALAMAGDLTDYGQRDNVRVIRTENGVVTNGTIDLTDANFINSPYYFLKQGDAILVQANEKKQMIENQKPANPTTSLVFQILGLALTATALIITLGK